MNPLDSLNPDQLKYMFGLGEKQVQKVEVNGKTFLLHPSGLSLNDLDEYAETPRALVTNHNFTSPRSFMEYFNRFANANSTIFIDREKPSMTAIIDYHEGTNAPRWGKHVAHLELTLSQEWVDWKEKNDKFQSQEVFGHFVEDHMANFIEPDSATMMEVALEMVAKKGVVFEQITRLNSGANSLVYREDIEATAKNQMEIPTDLTLALKVFEGIYEQKEEDGETVSRAVRYKLDGKFRFSIREKQLQLKYKLLNLDVVYDHAVDKLSEYVRSQLQDKGHVYEGKVR